MIIKEYVVNKKEQLKQEIANYKVKPHFVIMQVNEDEASNAYVRGKLKDANEIGIICDLLKYPTTISEEELINEVKKNIPRLALERKLEYQNKYNLDEKEYQKAIISGAEILKKNPYFINEPFFVKQLEEFAFGLAVLAPKFKILGMVADNSGNSYIL